MTNKRQTLGYDAAAVRAEVLASLQDCGLTAVLDHEFRTLKEFNATAPKWYPLIPLYDPDLMPASAAEALVLRAVDATGETKACIAARLRWVGTDLRREMEGGQFLFGEHFPEGCRVDLDAEGVEAISGAVAVAGAMYVHPDVHHQGLATTLYTLLMVEMHDAWHPDWVVGFVNKTILIKIGLGAYRGRTTLGFLRIFDPRWEFGDGRPYTLIVCSQANLRRRYLQPERPAVTASVAAE
ncbi:hypothetical protein [Azospirillum sp. B4]|uniref:hypothetical protein n=1 Tax=Azospirillum sp. B4 TaxID=95605 RepID=UPI0003496C74|nr:hypothetical protein [Azospirillum sp. B4]